MDWKYKVENWVLYGYVILILILMSPVYIGVVIKSIWKHKGSMLHVRKDLHKYFIKKDKEYKERKNE